MYSWVSVYLVSLLLFLALRAFPPQLKAHLLCALFTLHPISEPPTSLWMARSCSVAFSSGQSLATHRSRPALTRCRSLLWAKELAGRVFQRTFRVAPGFRSP